MKEESEQMHLTSRLQFWGKELVAHPFCGENVRSCRNLLPVGLWDVGFRQLTAQVGRFWN